MGRAELIDNLGTIARSGHRAFLDGLSGGAEGSALIGQFGVGFYSAFMVATSVEVVSRRAGSDEAWRWRSDGKGTFTVEPAALDEAPARGTRVTLTLSEETPRTYAEQAADRAGRRGILGPRAGADRLHASDGQAEKTLADGSALWRKPQGVGQAGGVHRVLRPRQRAISTSRR